MDCDPVKQRISCMAFFWCWTLDIHIFEVRPYFSPAPRQTCCCSRFCVVLAYLMPSPSAEQSAATPCLQTLTQKHKESFPP